MKDFDENEYSKFATKLSENRLKAIKRMNLKSSEWKQYKKPLIADIKYFGTLDGEGIRHSIYVTGCIFNCSDCYNKLIQTQSNGYPFTDEMEDKLIKNLTLSHVSGITYVGGEPFLNTHLLNSLTKRIKNETIGKTIWCYTGFLFETILEHGSKEQLELLKDIDVLIDGQYIKELRDESNLPTYRGSSNQRLIDVKKSLEEGKTVIYNLEEV